MMRNAAMRSVWCGILPVVFCLAPANLSMAGDIWIVGPSHKVARNERMPAAHSEIYNPATKTVNLFAARNEYVAFQIVYAGDVPGVDLGAISIANIGCIEAFREHFLPAPIVSQWSARVKPFDAVKLAESYQAAGYPREFPEQMVPLKATRYGAPFDVAPGSNEVIWVDVFVPEDAKPGEYDGSFKTAGQRFNIHLTVWNFALPAVSHFPQWAQTHPENIAWGFGKQEKTVGEIAQVHDAFYQMAHNHRLVLMEEWMWNGQVTANKFDTYASGNGFAGPFGKGFGFEVIPVLGNGMKPMLDAGNYYNRAFGMNKDEPAGVAAYRAVLATGAELKKAYGGKLRRFVTKMYNPPDNGGVKLEDEIDIFCSGATSPELIPELEKQGKVVWTYNEGYAGGPYIDAPGPAMRSQAWAGFVSGARCWYFWQACYWADWQCKGSVRKTTLKGAADPSQLLGDLWGNALTFDETQKKGGHYPEKNALRLNGDGVLFYPGHGIGIEGPIAGFRLKNLRQGATDFEYLYLLEKMGKKDVALAEAAKIVGVPASSPAGEDQGSGPAGGKFVNYDFNGANWDAARIRMGRILHGIGDAALRAKINPYNQYPNPVGSPDYYGGARY